MGFALLNPSYGTCVSGLFHVKHTS